MKLNNVLKGLMLALPMFAITACTDTGSKTGGAMGSDQDSMNQQARATMQELQKTNIVYFDFDKYDIRPDFAQILDNHAGFLRANPSFSVVLEGHADERGTPEYNIALGERRANAVKMYLQGRGVSASQMSIVSYGKEKPSVLGHDEAAYSKNRRAVIVY